MAGKPIFELHLEGFDGTSDRKLEPIGKMQRVVDGAHRAKLDGAAAEPFEHSPGRLITTERAAVVNADVPGETFARKRVRQPADVLCLLEKQDLLVHSGQCGRRRHAAHAGSDDDDVVLVFPTHVVSVVRVINWQRNCCDDDKHNLGYFISPFFDSLVQDAELHETAFLGLS